MKAKYFFFTSVLLLPPAFSGEKQQCDFLWGTASSSYQVEGGWNINGKGPSNWDYFTHNEVTKYTIGTVENGDIAANQISRDVYLKDIQLMKELGVNSYRFSISWSRIMPDGVTVNKKGLEYYSQLITDLKEANIEPVITLYHWDMPLALYKKGSWSNPESPVWFEKYAQVVFENFGSRSHNFITFNEPEGYIFTLEPLAANLINKKPDGYRDVLSVASRGKQAIALHNLLIANAMVVRSYHKAKYDGRIGIALNLSPCIDNAHPNSTTEKLCNDLHNNWILDALYKGTYPDSVLKMYQSAYPKFKPTPQDMQFITQGKPDFIGVNYYGPTLVKHDKSEPFEIGNVPNPDKKPSVNGPVSPEAMVTMMKEFDAKYAHPTFIITENGAGFGLEDEKLNDGVISDKLRADYLNRHVSAVIEAKKEGLDIQGYLFWSLLDNFEWLWGYKNRFGIIGVDFDDKTLKRTPKLSYYIYQKLIKENKNQCASLTKK
ncbi:beta-glucosidase [Enterobacter asburiae]|uniref:glycoside hydrolase family 1 protein n=1 Tax=Enterobacter TaxID=547 RepID=UPI0003ECDCD8|nr:MULTISPECIES: family 1 glycosylhydrolase [Enterobacter]ELP5713452.1 family 1 glycosylhydrolase [Enterobacter asburiae]EMA4736456.1 family 1 glycosylhydrolase [Enterobacter asburiae]EWG70284.1 Beta-glucosidase A [Enterobacter sp. DC1]NIH90929.1 beta-glucosidase [Enterobacter asburiae]